MGQRRNEQVVLSVGVHLSCVGGEITIYHFRPPSTVITAISGSIFTPNLMAAASSAPELVLLNVLTGNTVRQASLSSVVSHLQFCHTSLLVASIDGYVRVHDPRTGIRRETGETSVQAHSHGVQDLQATGNFFFTIGRSLRFVSSGTFSSFQNNLIPGEDMSFQTR